MKIRKVLFVGWGAIAKRHTANLKVLRPGIEIAALRLSKNPSPEKGLQSFRKIQEALAWGPDGAMITGPSTEHLSSADPILRAGLPVYVEKPLAADASVARSWVKRWTGARLVLGYNFRFYKPFLSIEKALKQGRIGKVLSADVQVGQYLPDWRPQRPYQSTVSANPKLGGGALLELSHEIDTALWWFGEVAEVGGWMGKISPLLIRVEDWVEMLLRFRSGVRARIHLDLIDRKAHRSIRILGTKGTIGWGMETHEAWIDQGKGKRLLHNGKAVSRNDMYLDAIKHWLQVAERGQPSGVDAGAGLKVLEVIQRFRKLQGISQ